MLLPGDAGLFHPSDDFFDPFFGNGQGHPDITFTGLPESVAGCGQDPGLLQECSSKFCGSKS